MSKPLRIFIVELVTIDSAEPIWISGDEAEAQAVTNAYNETTCRQDDDTPGPLAVMRKGFAFYQRTPVLRPVGI